MGQRSFIGGFLASVASLIAIVVFVTGADSLSEILRGLSSSANSDRPISTPIAAATPRQESSAPEAGSRAQPTAVQPVSALAVQPGDWPDSALELREKCRGLWTQGGSAGTGS